MIVCFVILSLNSIDALGSDWKFCGQGQSEIDGSQVYYYFDKDSIIYLSNDDFRIWTKFVKASEVVRIFTQNKQQIIDESVKKVAMGYQPPFSALSKTTKEEEKNIIFWELAANYPQMRLRSRALAEVDCKDKKMRTLSYESLDDRGVVFESSSTPQDWFFIAPDTIGDTLQKIFCIKRNLK